MDYAKPSDVVASMIDASLKKLTLGPRDLLMAMTSTFTGLYVTYKLAKETASPASVVAQAAAE